jgi:hypothetical protein
MEYTDEFEDMLEDLESCAIHLEICDQEGQIDLAEENYYAALLDDMINTYDIECDQLTNHTEAMTRIFRTRDESTALKHMETVHEAFLAEICDDYDATY